MGMHPWTCVSHFCIACVGDRGPYASNGAKWTDVMCVLDVTKGRWGRESLLDGGCIPRLVFYRELKQIITKGLKSRCVTRALHLHVRYRALLIQGRKDNSYKRKSERAQLIMIHRSWGEKCFFIYHTGWITSEPKKFFFLPTIRRMVGNFQVKSLHGGE